MPAHPKVSNEQVKAAWAAWGGERAAADALNISRTALRKRLRTLGIDSAKGAKVVMGSMGTKVHDSGNLRAGGDGSKTAVGNYPRAAARPIVRAMPTETATAEALPIPTLPPKARPVRVNLDNQRALNDATDRLSRAFNVETDPTLLLNAFLAEGLETWVAGKLSQAKPAEKRTRKKGEDSK